MRLISSRRMRRRFTKHVSDVNFTVTGSVFMPVTKVPCGPRETAMSRDQWLVVVTVVVWCLLRILYVLRRAWNRCGSVRQDSGDAGAQQASPILRYCNRLCFGAHYESSLWAQRNNHFTWLMARCTKIRGRPTHRRTRCCLLHVAAPATSSLLVASFPMHHRWPTSAPTMKARRRRHTVVRRLLL
jgi:hypothetical protein